MNRKLRALLLCDISKWPYWISVAFICRILFFFLVIHFRQYAKFDGFWGEIRSDSRDYLLPFDNFIKTGSYTPDYRMPGYGLLYLPLRLIFSKAVACNVIIIIQLLLSTVSVYILALCAKTIFKHQSIFYLTYYIYVFSSFSSLVDPVILTESISTSSLIFSVYFLTDFFNTNRSKQLILSGAFLTWTIFLKPVFCSLIILFFVLLVVAFIRTKTKVLPAFLFLIPFLLADGIWTIRNYIIYKQVSPLTRTVWFPWVSSSYLLPTAELVEAWGGDIQFVEPTADTYWFINKKPVMIGSDKNNDTVPFPAYIYTSQFNRDSLKLVKNMIIRIQVDSSMSVLQKKQYQDVIILKLKRYTQSIKTEKPFLYYVRSNYKRLIEFVFSMHTISRLFINNFITRFYSTYYYCTVFLSLLGFLLLIPFIFKLSIESVVAFIPIYTILIHPVFIKFSENRYLIPAYPFMIICASYSILWLYHRIFKEKHQPN
ncbi:MAG TPA: hypothetical protein VK783_07365 [Bacteroidia bacterium]|jgi:hypothetical protein|nr:hypothetical protein [Bacteroidia bacterium]